MHTIFGITKIFYRGRGEIKGSLRWVAYIYNYHGYVLTRQTDPISLQISCSTRVQLHIVVLYQTLPSALYIAEYTKWLRSTDTQSDMGSLTKRRERLVVLIDLRLSVDGGWLVN